MKKLLQLPLAGFASCIGRIHVNHISLEDSEGQHRVSKRRFWFGWPLIFLGNIAFRFRQVPLRVLHRTEWISWEEKLKLALRNETIPTTRSLLCEKIPGQPLSDLLRDLFLKESDVGTTGVADRLALIRLAVRALKGLHETTIQLADGQDTALLSHGDAAISNVLCCEETQSTEWFDFDLRHDYRVAAVDRQADDLRSLLFSAAYFLTEEALEILVEMVKQEYQSDDVWAALQRQVANGRLALDLFHLSQTRRLRTRYQINGLSAARIDRILVDLILAALSLASLEVAQIQTRRASE